MYSGNGFCCLFDLACVLTEAAMKKIIFLFVLVSAVFLTSCIIPYDSTKGVICIRNCSATADITDLFAMEKDSSGYSRIWEGNIKPDSCEYIWIPEGKYRLKIKTDEFFGFLFNDYTTGCYRNFTSGKTEYVIFDGDELYFED